MVNGTIKNIFANGILVDVDISKWTGEKQLTAEDLGIDPERLPKSFKLGKKSLIPPEVIAAIRNRENKARNLLNKMSYQFSFGYARFLPKKLLPKFDEEYQKIKQSFDVLVVDLIQNFSTYKMDMRQEFIAAAKEAHERLSKIEGIVDLKPVDDYVNEFLARIEEDYPEPHTLLSKFNMDYDVYQMEIPDLTEATINDVANENQKIRLIEEAAQHKIRKSMEEYAEKLVRENRNRANEVIQLLRKNLSSGKKYTEGSATAVSNMIENFLALDIVDDAVLKTKLAEFKAKYVDGQTAALIRESKDLQRQMLDDLIVLSNIILDSAQVKALAESYKQKLNI
jgi:hypothetical protein